MQDAEHIDFADDEIAKLVDIEEVLTDPEALAAARVALAKAPVHTMSTSRNETQNALFAVRMCQLQQELQKRLVPYRDPLVYADRLRTLYLTACSMANLDRDTEVLQYEMTKAINVATKAAWLEEHRRDEWNPGMASGTGWVTKYSATPLGKRQVQRADAAPPEPQAIQPVKPAAPTDTIAPWRRNWKAPKPTEEAPKANTSAAAVQSQNTAIAAVRNDVNVSPNIVVNVHMPPMPSPVITPPPVMPQATPPTPEAPHPATPQTPEPPPTTSAKVEDVDWKEIQKRLHEIRQTGQAFSSYRDMAERLRCSIATIAKAVKPDAVLRKWANPQPKRKQMTPQVFDLSEQDHDQLPQSTEMDPAEAAAEREVAEREAIWSKLLDEATPEDRAKMNAMSQAESEEYITLMSAEDATDEDDYDRKRQRRRRKL
jgi:hypothetical protein